jgi:hypothetical protein
MRYVILRDDDTNALTPVECLEKLYRPFLARGLPVNLATIPDVRSDACTPDGKREGFLLGAKGDEKGTIPLAANAGLTGYLRANPGFKIVQHGCHHDPFEFDLHRRADIVRRFEHGAAALREAGLRPSVAFVAPHDKFSSVAYLEAARRFRVISSGWFEWRRVPPRWWPHYVWKKLARQRHWRVGETMLLSHPGCLLSYTRPPEWILPAIKRAVSERQLTVLVTHWWEYFRNGTPDEPFIKVLHDTAEYLATNPDISVISFDALAEPANGEVPAGVPSAAFALR